MIEKSENDNDIKMTDKCAEISFKNNGFLFRSEDWDRLKHIAVGNPDEEKVYIPEFYYLHVYICIYYIISNELIFI